MDIGDLEIHLVGQILQQTLTGFEYYYQDFRLEIPDQIVDRPEGSDGQILN